MARWLGALLVALAGVGGAPAGSAAGSHAAAEPKPAAAESAKIAAPAAPPAKEKEAKGEAKDGEKADKEGAAEAKPAATAVAKKPAAPPHEPPPLSISGLREEIRHSPAHEGQTAAIAEREKLEQLAAEINKAREGLRQDTARLEALLEKRAAAAPPPPVTLENESGKKIPTTLDGLAKAMRGMKPEQAAPIISRLDRKMAADVLVRMPATDAGKVMGVCKPEVAAELASEIASRTPRSELKR